MDHSFTLTRIAAKFCLSLSFLLCTKIKIVWKKKILWNFPIFEKPRPAKKLTPVSIFCDPFMLNKKLLSTEESFSKMQRTFYFCLQLTFEKQNPENWNQNDRGVRLSCSQDTDKTDKNKSCNLKIGHRDRSSN